MKKTFSFLITLSSFLSIAQNNNPCGFDRYTNNSKLKKAEQIITKGVQAIQDNKAAGSLKLIPIIAHVIHNGGNENITEAQVLSAIEVLNEDYGKLADEVLKRGA